MQKKVQPENASKTRFFLETSQIDPLITFNQKSVPQNILPPTTNSNITEIAQNRKILNKIYFQEISKSSAKSKPSVPSSSSQFSNSFFPPKTLEISRLCLKSDSIALRTNKKNNFEFQNSSSYAKKRSENELFSDPSGPKRIPDFIEKLVITPKQEFFKESDEKKEVKTPTFQEQSEEKKAKPEKKKGFKLPAMPNTTRNINNNPAFFKFNNDLNELDLINIKKILQGGKQVSSLEKVERQDFSAGSKFTSIGSSISTDFPLLSPTNIKEKYFFQSHSKKNFADLSSNKELSARKRDHPKVNINKTGFPKDVFTYKNK